VAVVLAHDRLAALVSQAGGHVLEDRPLAGIRGDHARRIVVVLGLHVLDDHFAHPLAAQWHARII
jgi:hypothetical protein